jgi:DMSO reductase family type II enzyme chaperone
VPITTPSPEITHETGSTDLAAAHASVYRFLLAALDCPDARNHAWLTGRDFRRGLELLCERFEVPMPPGPLFPPEPADAQSLYLACFEVGLKGPPVPLLASHYNRHEPVPATIHEHVLFYRHFGAGVRKGSPDPPDHLRHELGFLVHLDDLWASGRVDAASAARARADFLERQVDHWVGQAHAASASAGLPPVYVTLLDILQRAVRDDLEWCRHTLSHPDRETS